MRIKALFLLLAALCWAEPIRVQVTTGGHDHELSFYTLFDGPEFQARVNPHPIAFRNDLRKNLDVLVLYDMTDTTDEKQMANLRAYVEAGGGLVVMHHALLDNKHWPWWYEQVVGGLYRNNQSKFRHDIAMKARAVREHPILRGIPAVFDIEDEGYRDMWLSPKIQPLLEVEHPDADRPVAWVGPTDKYRVVVIQLGHGPAAHRNPNYRRLVKNAIVWAAERPEEKKPSR